MRPSWAARAPASNPSAMNQAAVAKRAVNERAMAEVRPAADEDSATDQDRAAKFRVKAEWTVDEGAVAEVRLVANENPAPNETPPVMSPLKPETTTSPSRKRGQHDGQRESETQSQTPVNDFHGRPSPYLPGARPETRLHAVAVVAWWSSGSWSV